MELMEVRELRELMEVREMRELMEVRELRELMMELLDVYMECVVT